MAFEFCEFGFEQNHLRIYSAADTDELEKSIIELKAQEPEISHREIANRLQTNHMKVGRVLNRHNALT